MAVERVLADRPRGHHSIFVVSPEEEVESLVHPAVESVELPLVAITPFSWYLPRRRSNLSYTRLWKVWCELCAAEQPLVVIEEVESLIHPRAT